MEYRPASSAEMEGAIRLILARPGGEADEGQVREYLRVALAHLDDAGGLRVAAQGQRLLSAVMPVASPGRTMLIFPPTHLRDDGHERMTLCIIEQICARAAADGIHLVQTLLEANEGRIVAMLSACSFRKLAELLYMQMSLPRPALPPTLPGGYEWRTYAAPTHALFCEAVLNSYRNSLDCPALNGLRDVEDILAGHKATGEFDPALWFLLQRAAESVGVLLLSRVSRNDMVELVYLGLSPGARGHGLGDLLMRQAIAVASSSHLHRLSLAVDAGNLPALKLYWRHGMEAIGRRLAMLRDLRAVDVIVTSAGTRAVARAPAQPPRGPPPL